MAISSESRFFGLDLNQLKADILKTWRKAPQWPPLSWLQPEQALMLVPAEGTPYAIWESGEPATGVKRQPVFSAIELPESMVLRKTMQLPPLDPQDCASAAELEAHAISPFAAAEVLWGYTELSRSSKAVRLQLVLAARSQVALYLQAKAAEHAQVLGSEGGVPSEVWVFAPERKPIVIQGFGEPLRARAGRKKLLVNLAGVLVAGLLLTAIAITPTMQLRMRAIEAVRAFDGMAARTGDVVAKREQLMQSADKVAVLSALLSERIDSVKVLSMLTQVLPDDTALQSARIQGAKVTINGLTDNSSSLMQKLTAQEGVKEVKAPSAATRMQGVNKESFTVELLLDPKVFGPTTKVEEVVAAPVPAAEAGQSPAPTVASELGVAAPTSGTPLEAVKAPAPAQDAPKRTATLGGSKPRTASIGGVKTAPAPEGGRP